MSMLAMSMPPMPAMPAIGLAAAPAATALLDAAPGCAELLPPPAAGAPMPPPMPGMPPPICWAILAMFFMSSGFMPDIILDIILIWLGSIPASCGAMALSWSGSMFLRAQTPRNRRPRMGLAAALPPPSWALRGAAASTQCLA